MRYNKIDPKIERRLIRESIAARGYLWSFVLANLMLVSLLAAAPPSYPSLVGGAEGGWAAPGQDPQRQTVPTPPPPPTEVKTEIPPSGPGPVPPALPTSTSTPPPISPSASLPLPTATSVLATSMPVASPSAQLTLLPAPVGQMPTVAQICQPLEKMLPSLRSDELGLLAPCRILVQIPAGAMAEDSLLRLAPRLLTDAPPSEAWLQMRSVAFTLEVLSLEGRPRPGFIFAKPYTVTIRYNQTDVEIGESRANHLTIAYYDAIAHKWIPLDSQVDPKERLVVAEFDQPGWLALMLVLSKAEGKPTQQPASTPSPLTSGTGVSTIALTSVPSPSNQSGEANKSTGFLGIVGASFLLALGAGLYVANRRQRRN